MRRPHYYQVDSLYLLGKAEPMFYLRLGNGGILRLLKAMQSAGQSYGKFLSDYPAVCCEPLELFYLCRRGMNALNDELLQDLLFAYGWREANWGAWISALAPQRSFVAHLQHRRPNLPHGTTVIDLALAACGHEVAGEFREHYSVLQEVTAMLSKLPAMSAHMRLAPTAEHERSFTCECEALRKAYREGGASSAREQLSKGLLKYYGMSYPEWLAEGAPVAPKP